MIIIEIKNDKLIDTKLSSMETGDVFNYKGTTYMISHFAFGHRTAEVEVNCLVLKSKTKTVGKMVTLEGKIIVKKYEG